MDRFKLYELRCFDAVASEGSFQAAGAALGRSHPAVFSAVARLEQQLGFTLFDRSGYRVALTGTGRMFHAQARLMLRQFDDLRTYADQLASGEETLLTIVIGDLCPRPHMLELISHFFADHARTQVRLEYEAVSGPLERLLHGEADLIVHRADPSDPRLDLIDLGQVEMVPVVAPGFLNFSTADGVNPEQLMPFTQCVIRDTARRSSAESFFLIEGSPRCSVPDQLMKKELILHGLAWGHLPTWLIDDDLQTGRLLNIAGPQLPGRTETLAAVRLRRRSHGPVMTALWKRLGQEHRSAPLPDAAL